MDGKQVVPKEEFVEKIAAAKRVALASDDKDFVIIARTDAVAVNGTTDLIVLSVV